MPLYDRSTIQNSNRVAQLEKDSAELNAIKKATQDNNIYQQGAKDLYTEIERQMIAKAEQEEMDRQMEEAYIRSQTQLDPINQSLVDLRGAIGNKLSKGATYVGNAINGLGDYLLNAAIGTPEEQSKYKDLGQQQQREMEEYELQQAIEAAKRQGEM